MPVPREFARFMHRGLRHGGGLHACRSAGARGPQSLRNRETQVAGPPAHAALTAAGALAMDRDAPAPDLMRLREAHLSAAQQAPQAHPRFPQAHADPLRSPGDLSPSTQGPEALGRDGRQEVAGGADRRRIHSPEATAVTDSLASFPKSERIRGRSEYLEIQQGGRRCASEHLLLLVSEPQALGPTRVGLTVSKRIGGAVVRNRVKRRLRDVYRRHKAWLPASVAVVIVARRGLPDLPLAAVERELEGLCDRCFR